MSVVLNFYRFGVRMHSDIKDDLRWRTGVVLEEESMGAVPVVKSDEREREITIEVGGEQKRARTISNPYNFSPKPLHN